MYSIVMMMGMLGYGIGYEGYDDGKMYFGVYAGNVEYGWVMTEKKIYLDIILEKGVDKPK